MNTASSSRLCSCLAKSLRSTRSSATTTASQLLARRQKHTLPNLPYSVESSLEPFLSTKALRGTAVEWHQGQLDRLNDLVRGTQYENKSVAQTIMDSSKRREDALIFGHASEALNNGFFLSGLTPETNAANSFSQNAPQLSRAIQANFGSETSFINYFSSYASGMFGSGYTWLVMDRVDNLAVLGTYGSGTVLVQGNEIRAKELEPFIPVQEAVETSVKGSPAASSSSSSSSTATTTSTTPSSSRQYHTSSKLSANSRIPPQKRGNNKRSDVFDNLLSKDVGSSPLASRTPAHLDNKRFVSIHPIFCLSLQPHVFIPDYGIMGKEAYIKNFWKNIDWAQAERRYTEVKEIYRSGSHRMMNQGYSRHDAPVRHPMESLPPGEALNPEIWEKGIL